MIGSPSNLELLLHCYYSNQPHERHDAPAILEGTSYLVGHGMIECNYTTGVGAPVYNATDRGIAFIDHLMTVPFPVSVWTIPKGSASND